MKSGARREISEVLSVYRSHQGVEEVRIFDLKGHEVFSQQQGPDETRVQEMVRTGEIIHFDKEINGGPAASFLIPIRNKPECYRCHGKSEALRGGLLLSLSLKEMKQDLAQFKRRFYLLFSLFNYLSRSSKPSLSLSETFRLRQFTGHTVQRLKLRNLHLHPHTFSREV